MSKNKEVINQHLLVLCQQYNSLGMLLRAESEAMVDKNIQTYIEARRGTLTQFKEMGEQLKMFALDMEDMG